MSYELNVLVKKEDYEEKTLKEIHDELINFKLFDQFKGTFDYFSLWDSDNNKSFFGKDKPDELKTIICNWNKDIIAKLNKAEKNIHERMQKNGDKYISEYILKIDSSKDDWQYTMCNFFDFKDAFLALTNEFSFGQNWIYFSEDWGWNTYLPGEIEKDAVEHPENYILVQCFYH